MQIFAEIPRGGGVKRQWGCRRRHFIGYFGGYVFGNFREKASNVCSLQTKTNKKAVLCQGNRTMPYTYQNLQRHLPAIARLSC